MTVTRKMGVDPVIARRKLELFARMSVVVNQVDDVLAAVDLARLHTLSFWDALIVRAAQQAECRVIYSEDMQHGWKVDGVEVVNPLPVSPARVDSSTRRRSAAVGSVPLPVRPRGSQGWLEACLSSR